jgi:hypothetical protein
MARRIYISAIIAAVLTTACLTSLAFFPNSLAPRVFIAIGIPLGTVLMYVIPDSVIYKMVPSGGAETTVFIFSVSAFITIFLILFFIVYFVRPQSIDRVDSDGPVM